MAVSISQLTELTSILDDDVFPITAVRSTKSTGKVKYSTIKQSILNSVPKPVSDWGSITNKPFTSIGVGLSVDTNGILSASGLDFATLSGMIVQGTNMSIITDSNAKTITFNATGGIDFDALSTAMTTGTQSGITVTADSTNNRFNFEVTGVPTIAIDSEGYWTIDGERGTNPTKAQGNDGFSPTAVVTDTGDGATITITDKNGTTTVDIYDGADGVSPTASVTQTETGCSITVVDGSGTTTADLTNGADGISPHIDETTKHWFIGTTDTGVGATASIDDTSIDGVDVSWSASKLNSMLGNINTILASVTGGIS